MRCWSVLGWSLISWSCFPACILIDLSHLLAKEGEGNLSFFFPLTQLIEDLELIEELESLLGVCQHPNGAPRNLEMLIHWQDLPLFEATWEDFHLLNTQFPAFHLEDKVKAWGEDERSTVSSQFA